MLTDLLNRTHSCIKRTLYIFLTSTERKNKGIFCTTDQELTQSCRSTQTRFWILVLHLVEAFANHIRNQVVNISISLILHSRLLCIWCSLTLHIKCNEHDRLFRIFQRSHNHLVVVAYWEVFTMSSILGHWNSREDRLNLLLYLVYINITHNDDSLQIWAIPLVVIVTKCLVREVVYNLHLTDWQTVFILRTAIDNRQSLLHQAL